MAKFLLIVASLYGAALADEPTSNFDPKQSSATNMVIKMLQDAKDKVTTEGEMEKKTFEKFSTWCNETKDDKTEDINTGSTSIGNLEADINKGESDNSLNTAAKDAKAKSIEDNEKALKDKIAEQKQGLEDYTDSDKELMAASAALDKAIEEMKAHQTTSAAFIQKESVTRTLHHAVMLADALGLKNAQAAAVGLNSEDFSYSSIIDTLEGLLTDFRARKNKADMDQVKATATFKSEIQVLEQTIASEKKAKSDLEDTIATTTKKLAADRESLAETKKNKQEDETYLNETTEICDTKTRVYNQRKAMREEEVTAIETAKQIMEGVAVKNNTALVQTSSDSVQDSVLLEVAESRVRDPEVLAEAAAEAEDIDSAPVKTAMAFLQRREQKEIRPVSMQKREEIAALLEKTAMKIGSSRMAKLAAYARGPDPFKTIKKMITDMLAKLQKQAEDSQNKKASCDKKIGESEVKRDTASSAVTKVNRNLAEEQARYDQQTEDLAEFNKTLEDLLKQEGEADTIRADEANESSLTIVEAKEAISATKAAIQVLTEFYKKSAEAEVPEASLLAQPDKDAPDAFKDEAYTGDQAGSKGIVGMLEVIKSNFERTVSETEASEKEEIAKYEELKTDIATERAKKKEAEKVTLQFQGESAEEIDTLEGKLTQEIGTLKAGLLELAAHEIECGHGATYEARKAAREEELASLKQCIEIFDQMFAENPDALA
mmetsp:Transcript_89790/g.159649  ORF Transcript_89790/g.159649 Transcript_89790/m.159649 type:complete len:718 (+) Transcript_89790:68-2221(+)|eukprot:CAMPEP_0197648782 /NCGR_PEP_ID=MMETSP1338-20131121/27957_1 /TAXON_ID=43686 ORGANISM="Pelagodinium beii, Strain RCC1491" /NCGR_SAMPLE_ID=MMETSP1338 /ASSEMBLY_ACC=CAM_ASM_000754 /LENGTH=717 /DNA_ID=CAMNT_0043222837 /DNA_START=69 /DNA_END=2222 /DNA_ORIENTATION=+